MSSAETIDDMAGLYRSHGHVVLRRATRLLGNEEDARDILQQVFAALVAEPDGFRGESSIATYLYRVTTNLCLQHIRNRSCRQRILSDWVVADQPSAVPAAAEISAIVQQIVSQLPDELASIMIYHFVDGMTQDEIAEQLGCSRRQVGNLIEKARALAQERECA